MLSLSITTGYATKALMCLGSGDGVPRHISDLAHCSGVPGPYLAKIIAALSQHGLVSTKRGYRGGISLARDAKDISLLQIVEAVEGDQWLGECLLGMDTCDVLTICPTHDFWARIRREIIDELGAVTLGALNHRRATGSDATNSKNSRCTCRQAAKSRQSPRVPKNSLNNHEQNS